MANTELILVEKRCTTCEQVKPLMDFHRNRNARDGHVTRCKSCTRAAQSTRNAKMQAALGDDAWNAHRRQIVQAHRDRTDNAQGKAYNAARSRAVKTLIERHRAEFDHLLAIERWEDVT